MARFFTVFLTAAILCCGNSLSADTSQQVTESLPTAQATYLGNEGVMISHGESKVLFDPFFHNDYGTYQLVPEQIRDAIFSGSQPFDGIDAVFISHAHGDHFSADDVVKFLSAHPSAKVVAPAQAIGAINKVTGATDVNENLVAIDLEYKDSPVSLNMDSIRVDAVRIPHAGWPQRAEISNIVFRVTLEDTVTVIHMGDADPNDEHFKPLIDHWQKQLTDTAFPPYWFFGSAQGRAILSDRINAKESIGVHVPVNVPEELQQSGERYFSKPGETHSIVPVIEQEAEPQAVEMTYLKANPQMRLVLARFIEANWFSMDAKAVKAGLMQEFEMLTNADPTADWDLLVKVTYFDSRGYEGIKDQFNVIRDEHDTVLIDGKSLKELGTIVRSEKVFKY